MRIRIYEDAPAPEAIEKVVHILQQGGVIIYPTDTLYGMGCAIDNARAVERIMQLKGIKPKNAQFSFICESISQVAEFARISDSNFQLMRRNLPGPFTFVLPGLNRVPSYFISARKTVGIRIPNNTIPCTIVKELGIPILTTSLPYTGDEAQYAMYPELMEERWGHAVDIVIDGGVGALEGSTVVDCTGKDPDILRQGKGHLDR